MAIQKQRQIIAIDIDDVLSENAKGFVEFSNHRWGTSLKVEDYDEHWGKLWQVNHIETERRANEFHESGVLSSYEHIPSARLALEKLKKKYKLIVITSRRLQTKGETVLWIKERYSGIFAENCIHFAGIWDTIDNHSIFRTKGELSKELGADYIIDDQLKHCLAAAEVGVQALLFGNYSWNQMDKLPQNVQRVKNWSEVLEYFDEI